jgi:hypothetical protein
MDEAMRYLQKRFLASRPDSERCTRIEGSQGVRRRAGRYRKDHRQDRKKIAP